MTGITASASVLVTIEDANVLELRLTTAVLEVREGDRVGV